MAWTTPRDWTGTEFVTEAIMDTHVKDNLNALRNGQRATIVQRTSAQTLTLATWVALNWSTETRDDAGAYTTGTDVPVIDTGLYLVQGQVLFAGGTGTADGRVRVSQIRAAVSILDVDLNASAIANAGVSGGFLFQGIASDAFRLSAYHNYGGTAPTATGWLSVMELRMG